MALYIGLQEVHIKDEELKMKNKKDDECCECWSTTETICRNDEFIESLNPWTKGRTFQILLVVSSIIITETNISHKMVPFLKNYLAEISFFVF